jgi:hypothetical protein
VNRESARWTVLLGLLGTCIAVACTVQYARDPEPGQTDAGATDAGAQDTGSQPDAGPTCTLALPPPPPTTEDGDPLADNVVSLVARSVRATPGDGGIPGFDLDGVCTCPAAESCQKRDYKVDNLVVDRCDGPGGRDNAAAAMIVNNPFLSTTFDNNGQGLGTVGGDTFVLELSNYNGGQNDKQVTLALASSTGFRPPADAGPDAAPLYDGTDTWDLYNKSLDPGAVTGDGGTCGAISRGGCLAKSLTKDAYVTGGVLVAKFDGLLPWPFGGFAGTELDIRRGYLVANVVGSSEGVLRLENAVLAGRVTEKDLLDGWGRAIDPLKGVVEGGTRRLRVCESPLWPLVRDSLCAYFDVHADQAKDNTGEPCSAMSFALQFETAPIRFGRIRAPQTPPNLCPADWLPKCP